MPLSLPSLDSRTFEELQAEGRRMIPRHAPEWTDHNASDPGITLMELFAWLTEAALYRLDRLPEASYRAFLHLLGLTPNPAGVASTVLRFGIVPAALSARSAGGLTLPAGIQVEDPMRSLRFQTTQAVYVSPARLEAVLTASGDRLANGTRANDRSGTHFSPLGPLPDSGDALYLGFDAPLGDAGARMDMHVWTADPIEDETTRKRLVDEAEALLEAASRACPPGRLPNVPDWRSHYGARTKWEYYTTDGTWSCLDGVTDETRALSLSGPVRFTIPNDHAAGGPAANLYFIRCRLACGRYECPPQIDRIAVNTARARHAADVPTEERLGISDGTAGQVYRLLQVPVVAGSTRLRLAANGTDEPEWMEVANWDRIGPHEEAYRLDPASGEIHFGDGRAGRVPREGVRIDARYAAGGGPDGNVAAGSLTRLPEGDPNADLVPGWDTIGPALRVEQPFPAAGGWAAESLADAQGRAVDELARRCRAVTLEDFVTLALETPGVPIARAHALVDHHPSMPCVEAAGCVTVVAVPRCPEPAPTPGACFLKAVARYLHRRRTVTTEVSVVGPTYRQIAVRARIHAAAGSPTRAADALAALDAFFHPLTGGPVGGGWPFGRNVYRSEVLALLQDLPGILHVDAIRLDSGTGCAEPCIEPGAEPCGGGCGGGCEGDCGGARCGHCEEVTLCPGELVASGRHHIELISEDEWS